MSSDFESPLRLSTWMTPTVKGAVICFGCIAVGAYMLSTLNETASPVVKANGQSEQNGVAAVQAGAETASPELHSELAQARDETRQLADQVARLEASLNQAGGIEAREALARSEHAVNKVKFAEVSALCDAATRDLGKIRKLQADWAVIEDSMMTGESGRRVAGSPQQLQLVFDIWQRSRPSAEQMVQWERQLTALTEIIDNNASDETVISITDEHSKLLSDLGKELATQAAEFEQQKLLLESIHRETSGLKPGNVALVDAIEQHRGLQDKVEAARLTEVRDTARAQAEKELTERITKAERELAEAKGKADDQRIQNEKQQLADEARLQDLLHKAKLAGLKEEAKRVEEALQEAQLERAMQRDMNEIRGLLLAYMAPGFTYRLDDTKGPVSLSVIKSRGGLEPTRQGLQNLFFVARGNSDRPPGGMPEGVGGQIASATNIAPIERAQQLLIKYGDLMVKKEMLAP